MSTEGLGSQHVEAALRESEERFRAIFSQAAVGIAQTSIQGEWLLVNNRFSEIVGYTQAELRGKTFVDITHPDDREANLVALHQFLAGEMSSRSVEKRYIHKDGATVWARLHISLVRDQHQVPQYFVVVVEDITDRIQAERALQESEQRLLLALSAGVGVWDIDLRAKTAALAPQYCRVFGQPPRTPTEWFKMVHPDDRERLIAVVRESIDQVRDWDAEFRLLSPNGSVRWLLTKGTVLRGDDGQPARMSGVSLDITERKRAEEALRESQQRFELAQGAGEIGTWDWDAATNETHCSIGHGPLYGLPPSDRAPTFEEWLELIHPEDQARMREELNRALEGIEHFITDFRVIWPDGTVHWLYGKGQVFRDSRGAPVRMIGVNMDITERKRAEAARRESEERFRIMADAAPVMIWLAGPDKGATFFNKCCLDFSGRTMEEKLGDGWTAGLHPEDRERYLALYSSSIDARQEFRSVFRLRRADGEYPWVLCTGVPRFSPGGVFSGYIGSCVEITDQKLIEEGLRASETRLMAAQRLTKVGSWERRIDGDAIQWSEEMLRIFGLPNGGPSNLSTFLTYVHPHDREKILEVDAKVRSSIAPVEAEYRIIRPDSEVRFVRSIVEGIRDDRGVVVRITGATQDITEQVRASELLRESERRLKNAERLAHVGHWQWDIRANRVSGSEEMFRIFGKPQDYIPSYEGFLGDLMPQDRERLERLVRDSLERKIGHSIEYQIAHPSGEMSTISCIWEVLLDEEGLPVRLFGTCQDITDSRRAQEESVARQKLESVGTLASGIAHDFNNLLGGVLAQAELALVEYAAGSSPEEELNRIRNVAIRGSEIVRQLMIYAGRESAVLGLVDVSRIVKEMVELLEVSVSGRAVLEMDLGQDLPALQADAAQLRQIVMNLVTNASDAMRNRDGVIRVTTRCVKAGNSPGNGLAGGDRLQLEVSDTGCGMTPETQAKAFDPFFSTKSAAGHGLGLAVVYGIVRGLGGTIVLKSELDKGTKFQVLLPCAETKAGTTGDAMSGVATMGGPSQSATLLVVEDEASLREAVAKVLRNTGFEVFEAADGSTAIEVLRANGGKIDVMLLDMTIPGASSPEVVAEAVKAWPDIRMILTSAYSQEMFTWAMSVPQIRSFIRKPFQLGDLVKALRNILSS
jgi:two-component system, cell cycle sensor histidine kinase and response regulator CckA